MGTTIGRRNLGLNLHGLTVSDEQRVAHHAARRSGDGLKGDRLKHKPEIGVVSFDRIASRIAHGFQHRGFRPFLDPQHRQHLIQFFPRVVRAMKGNFSNHGGTECSRSRDELVNELIPGPAGKGRLPGFLIQAAESCIPIGRHKRIGMGIGSNRNGSESSRGDGAEIPCFRKGPDHEPISLIHGVNERLIRLISSCRIVRAEL